MNGTIQAFDGLSGTILSDCGELLSFEISDLSSSLEAVHVESGSEVLFRRSIDKSDLGAKNIVLLDMNRIRSDSVQHSPGAVEPAAAGFGSIRFRTFDEPEIIKPSRGGASGRKVSAKPRPLVQPSQPSRKIVHLGELTEVEEGRAVLVGVNHGDRWSVTDMNFRRRKHFASLMPGEKVEYRRKRLDQGYSVFDVSVPRLERQLLKPEISASEAADHKTMFYGRIKTLREDFGFIVGDDGSDYYFNRKKMTFPDEYLFLGKGDKVTFRIRHHTNGNRFYADSVARVVEYKTQVQDAEDCLHQERQELPAVPFMPSGPSRSLIGIQSGVVMEGPDSIQFIGTADGRRYAFHRNEIVLREQRDFITVGHPVAFFARGQGEGLTAIDVTLITSDLPPDAHGVLCGTVALCNWRSGLIRGDDGNEYSFKRTGSLLPGTRVVFEKGTPGKRITNALNVVVEGVGMRMNAGSAGSVCSLLQCIETDPCFLALGSDAKFAINQLAQMLLPAGTEDTQAEMPEKGFLQKALSLFPRVLNLK
jgi:cold shock CspA family protein